LKSFSEDSNKKRLHQALSQYVSSDIAWEILHRKWNVNLNGERKYISIFFSDIEWFTTISEKMKPEELVSFLREYLWAMSHIIMDKRWLVDKFEWDAIMALWWVFWHETRSTYDNCCSAIEQQKQLSILNIEWQERFWEKLKIRMWLHSWEAIVWNIWAEWRKMEYTALWDSVNLASRLEEVNKKYGTYLCVSENIYLSQKEHFSFRYLDQIRVKGKSIAVKIYELIWYTDETSDLQKDIIRRFEEAIKLYLSMNFLESQKIFSELSQLWDNPSDTYIWRCKIYTKNPPENDWDWVWTMKTK
jgi:adenylate cyclase